MTTGTMLAVSLRMDVALSHSCSGQQHFGAVSISSAVCGLNGLCAFLCLMEVALPQEWGWIRSTSAWMGFVSSGDVCKDPEPLCETEQGENQPQESQSFHLPSFEKAAEQHTAVRAAAGCGCSAAVALKHRSTSCACMQLPGTPPVWAAAVPSPHTFTPSSSTVYVSHRYPKLLAFLSRWHLFIY